MRGLPSASARPSPSTELEVWSPGRPASSLWDTERRRGNTPWDSRSSTSTTRPGGPVVAARKPGPAATAGRPPAGKSDTDTRTRTGQVYRSEEHTSELQSRGHLVCRLLLEKKKNKIKS